MSNKTWCIYPFVHLATFTDGSVTPCCVAKPYKNVNLNHLTIEDAWNHTEVVNLRSKIMQGIEVENCRQCYIDESLGVDSHRTSSNRMFKAEYNLSEDDFLSPSLELDNLITFDLRLGNTCNLKCVMCRPNESHKWYEDIVKLNNLELTPVLKHNVYHKLSYNRTDYNWINNTVFWENIDDILPNIKEFIFGGGEPFMLKEVKRMLQKAIDLKVASQMSIRFHTNGTYLTSKDFELFQHFKRIQLMFSVDGVDQINHLLRYPAEWDKIINNINECEKYGPNVESFILCSLTSISAYYLDQLYTFVHEQNWSKLPVSNIILGRVHHPNFLNPQTLDPIRKSIIERKFKTLIDTYVNSAKTLQENLNWIIGNNDILLIDDTLSFIINLSKIRNHSYDCITEFMNAI